MKKNGVGMTEAVYNLIADNLYSFELDMEKGIILNRNAKSLHKGKTGYLNLEIKQKKVYHHQILAVSRWGKECIGMTVNHINENKLDNSWNNLELLSHKDNVRLKTTKTGRYKIVPIRAINIDTGEILIFETQGTAAKELKLNKTSIFQQLEGRRKRVGRYTFERVVS